jgi:hypothetical protein
MFQNENLVRLKELSDKICLLQDSKCKKCECKDIVLEIKNIIEIEVNNIAIAKTKNQKFNCYERMCFAITNLIKKIK